MSESISVDKAKKIIASAFQPFQCSVEVYDHGNKVRFRVLRDVGITVQNFDDLSIYQVTDPQRLLSLLDWARLQTETQVASLDPWECPEIE